ncbi:MAG: ROK family protein [Candidatus Limiplasma sp.]|nr:ROK family protein [Candidatus Limiplasma sp.]
MGHFLGIDLGGTNIVAGVMDGEYRIIRKSQRPTHAKRSFEAIVADMAAAAMDALSGAGLAPGDVPYVGIGVPSCVDPVTHRLSFANNLGWRDVDVVAEFQKSWNVPIHIANDADCAALGECHAGAGQAYDHILMITLGTGVGGGIVLHKKLFLGGEGYGVEPGHTLLVEDGFLCTCGQKGCLEAYASVMGLIRQSIDMMMVYPDSLMWEECGHDLNKVEGRTAFEAAKRGDPAGKMVVDQYIRYLAAGLASMINLLRPQAIIVGGGVSNAGEFLLEPLRREVARRVYSGDTLPAPPIVQAELGNDAGVIGAALLGV